MTERVETPRALEPPPLKPSGTARRISRRWGWRAAIAFAVVLAGLAAADQKTARRTALSALACFYSVIDPWSHSMPVDFGPAPTGDLASAPAGRSADRLHEWFPGNRFLVRQGSSEAAQAPSVRFRHENLAHPQISALREVGEAVAPRDLPLLEVCDRFRRLTRHGNSAVQSVKENPLELIKLARQSTPLTCRPFAMGFLGLCVSRGYTARILGLSRNGESTNHAVVEVYAPEFGKWIVIDPDFDMAYRNGDRWLDAWELHEAWTQVKSAICDPDDSPAEVAQKVKARRAEISQIVGVESVRLGAAWKELGESSLRYDSWTQKNLEYFEYVLYHLRNDYLSATYPPAHPVRVRQYILAPAGAAELLQVCPEAVMPRSRDDLYWKVGCSAACIVKPVAGDCSGQVLVELATWTPNFSAFEIRMDDEDWRPAAGRSVVWYLHPGRNTLEVRSVNLGGLRGESARIEVSREPRNDPPAHCSN